MSDTPPPATPTPPVYAQPGAVAYGPPTNTLAILALVFGIVFPIGGIVCGHIALGQIRRTGEAGQGLAQAGLIIGYVLTGLTVLFFIGYIAVFVAFFSAIPWSELPRS